eukprot:Amastigsp_a340143_185.p3 type:complete len:148 gc:universal Amastigsp_a340143_185:1093-650(-)
MSPNAHTSDENEYPPSTERDESIRSGDMYAKVPTNVCALASVDATSFETPKSVSLTMPSAFMSTFAGFRSRCTRCRSWCRYLSARHIWNPISRITHSGNGPCDRMSPSSEPRSISSRMIVTTSSLSAHANERTTNGHELCAYVLISV